MRTRCKKRLADMCSALSPDARIYLVIMLFLLFAALSVYCTASALCNLGHGSGEQLRIEHIEPLRPCEKPSEEGTPETANTNDYERTEEKDR